MKGNGRTQNTLLWQRPATPKAWFSQVEKVPPPKRKQIGQILDDFLGSEKVKKSG
ncbi:MAG: hypothetical protein AABZ10_13485 [Nitrospirota bacterium]